MIDVGHSSAVDGLVRSAPSESWYKPALTFNPKVARSRLARPTRLVTLRTRTRRADEGDVQGDVVGLVRPLGRSRMAMCGGMSSTSAAIERENSTVSGSAFRRW